MPSSEKIRLELARRFKVRRRVERRLGIRLDGLYRKRKDAKPSELATLDKMLSDWDAGVFDPELDSEFALDKSVK